MTAYMVSNSKMTAYRVPHHDEAPSDEMIEWLHTCPHEWNGDESGIVIEVIEDHPYTASPGDWVVCSPSGWTVVSAKEMDTLLGVELQPEYSTRSVFMVWWFIVAAIVSFWIATCVPY